MNPSLLLPSSSLTSDLSLTEPNLIINDEKEPLLRAFENHATKRIILFENKMNKNKELTLSSMESASSINSQSTEAESSDSGRTGSNN